MHIHYITNTRNGLKIGERNQALGVVDALRAAYEDAIILEHDVSEIAHLQYILKKFNAEQHVIIGVSRSGVSAFSQLPKERRHIGVLLGHEVPDCLETVMNKISILAIPSFAGNCPESCNGVTIIRTDGVSNTMKTERAEAAYLDWKDRFPVDKNQSVIVVLLGGAVDGIDFQPGETVRIAEYVAAKARKTGAYVLASNSPRTKPEDTEVFTAVLDHSGCGNAFFPFHMKNQNNETPYRAMIGLAARRPENQVIITGDSVSMPCEIARIVSPEQIWLYPVSNMNEHNREFMDWMVTGGWAGRVDSRDFTEEQALPASAPLMNAAGQIAQAVMDKL